MTKIALIADTHWGIRNDSEVFHNHTKKFLDDVFFPRLASMAIDHVVHLGDIVDRRKYINYLTAKRLRSDFLDPLKAMGVTLDIIAGNHDVYYKNTNSVNALNELIDGRYDNVRIFTQATTVEHLAAPILYVPWINNENREHTLKEMETTNAQIVFGHLELAGFQMYRGASNSHGDDPSSFSRFDVVCSGHYHHRSSSGGIHYLGSPLQFTWSDFSDSRGFHIFDEDTRELEFVPNPSEVFHKLYYEDSAWAMDEVMGMDFSHLESKYVKVVIQNKSNPWMFDVMMDKVLASNPAHVQVVEDHLNLALEDDEEIVNEAEDTLTLFRKYVTNIDSGVDRDKLNRVITDVYNEAMALR